ncbi:MAG: cupin domain-containing protein [Cephaloticoccus sp.]
MDEAEIIIARLGLAPLPDEGGFFRRMWTAPTAPGVRPAGTAILYLVTPAGFSALHRLPTDEVWHFHAGDPLALMWLMPGGAIERATLGADIVAGHQPQAVVPVGAWQGARLADGAARGWSLVGCTLAPGWDEKEFTLGDRAALCREFPAAADEIIRLTR